MTQPDCSSRHSPYTYNPSQLNPWTQHQKKVEMCRTTEHHFSPRYRPKQNLAHPVLAITAFHVRLFGLNTIPRLPDSLTLVLTNSDLFASGSKIRPGSNYFVSLHRVLNVKTHEGEAVFWSREPVWTTESVRFEVYLGEERVLEGGFVRDEENWRLNCRTALEGDCGGVAAAEVKVSLGGHVELCERVVLKSRTKSLRRRRNRLESIPEESDGSDGRWCECGRSDGEDCWEETCGGDCREMEMELEGVSWAVDVGLWVMCLGVGILVSKASARSLRRLRLL